MRSVFHSKFPCPRNSQSCTSSGCASTWTCPRGDLSLSFSFVRMFLTVKHCNSEPFLVSIFALFVSFSYRCFALSWSFRSISDCTPISMFVSIHSTSSLRGRGLDTHRLCSNSYIVHLGSHPSVRLQRGVSLMNSSPSEPCYVSLQLVSLRLESRLRPLLRPPRTSSRVSFALPQQQLYIVLCVLGHIPLLRKIRVVLGLRCCLSLLCGLFEVDLLKLDDLLSVRC